MGAGALKVLVVPEQLRRRAPGGIGTYAEGLLDALAQKARDGDLDGVEISLYASAPTQGPDSLERFGFPITSSRLPGPALVRLWDVGLSAPSGADLVHHVSLSGPPTSAPVVTTVYDLAWRRVPETFPRRGRRWHEAALRRAIRRHAHIVVPSEATRVDLVDAGVAPDLVTLIPGGADHLVPSDDSATEALLQRLGIRDGFLLAVGTREPRKNLERLVAAYAAVRGDLATPIPLLLVGPHGWGGDAEVTPPGVIAAGRVAPEVLTGLYERARLVCYVPLFEGFGLPVLEAMASGVPVVSSAVPSAGEATELVEATSVDSIAAGILAVANNKSYRETLVARGRVHAAGFTWSATAQAHLSLWRRIGGR